MICETILHYKILEKLGEPVSRLDKTYLCLPVPAAATLIVISKVSSTEKSFDFILNKISPSSRNDITIQHGIQKDAESSIQFGGLE